MPDDFAEFEEAVADVADPFDEHFIDTPVDPDLIKHIFSIFAHLVIHAEEHWNQATDAGKEPCVIYSKPDGVQLAMQIRDNAIYARFTAPPDVLIDTASRMGLEA